MKKYLSLIMMISLGFYFQAKAQDDEDLESEVNAAQPVSQTPTKYPPPVIQKQKPQVAQKPAGQPQARQAPPEVEVIRPTPPKKYVSPIEAEEALQKRILERKKQSENEVSADRNLDRFPKQEPLFKRPPGPPGGGTVRVEHPRAAEGLLRVNKDGSYQYKTQLIDKSQSSSLRFASMTAPVIKGQGSNVTYSSMYGDSNLLALLFDYEWQPFRSFGALGLQLEGGLTNATAKGNFRTARPNTGSTRSEESYNLFIVPMSAFVIYRFEYFRHQWVVPFVNGGATYYGMAEVRDDGKTPSFAGAPAVGGGGGLMFSLTRLDSAGAFTLSQEYGVADMWLVLEARAMQGLYSDTDFSGQSVNAGIAVDF